MKTFLWRIFADRLLCLVNSKKSFSVCPLSCVSMQSVVGFSLSLSVFIIHCSVHCLCFSNKVLQLVETLTKAHLLRIPINDMGCINHSFNGFLCCLKRFFCSFFYLDCEKMYHFYVNIVCIHLRTSHWCIASKKDTFTSFSSHLIGGAPLSLFFSIPSTCKNLISEGCTFVLQQD